MSFPQLNSGALEAVELEVTQERFEVDGEIPTDLAGTLMRNGPNPLNGRFIGKDVLSWWPESAMVHGVSFRHGNVLAYRNRWLRTQAWARHNALADADQYPDTNPNVNVIAHAGQVLALAEGGPPLAIDRQLNSLPAGSIPTAGAAMTAHPKFDPQTGELFWFRSHWSAPFLRYGVTDPQAVRQVDMSVDVPAPAMTHDMAITASRSILMDLNVGYDFALLERGVRIPIRWRDDRRSRLCVLPRYGGEPIWVDIEPCFIQHVVNAWDREDGTVVLDVVRYPEYFRIDPHTSEYLPDPLGVLYRYEIDAQRNRVNETQLDDLHVELPRINEQFTGRPYRYCYAVVQPSTQEMRGVVRYDLHTGERQLYEVAPGDQNSEPVFVPRPGGTAEEDGWVLVSVYRKQSHTNEIHILDARDLTRSAVAVVHLEHRIPAGFHGAWIADDVLSG